MASEESGASARVFFALMLGAELGGRLMESTRAGLGGDRAARRGFRLPRPEGLHLTLFFLGDVAGELLPALWDAVRAGAETPRSPELRIDHAGSFPKPGRERVLWFGVREAGRPGRLEALHRRAVGASRSIGHDTRAEQARPFRPHITVARPRSPGGRGARVPPSFYALAPELAWSPQALALVESVHAEQGPPHYRPIRELPLEP